MEQTGGSDLARRSAMIYTAISLTVALVFLVASSATGEYSPVARFGGAVWVFMLSMIVSMPLVTTLSRRVGRRGE